MSPLSLSKLLPLLGLLLPLGLSAAACSDDADTKSDGGAVQDSGALGRADAASDGSSAVNQADAARDGVSAANQPDAAGDGGSAANSDAALADGAVGGARGPGSVSLGKAGGYVILAKAAISNVPTSAITGNLGLSPAAATYVTGFALTRAGDRWSSPQVTGNVFAADNDPPSPTELTTAVDDMQTAYTDAAGRPNPTVLNLGAGSIGGMTLAPGLYRWTSSLNIPTDVVLQGAATDTWIFQITGDLELSAAKRMTLSGGALAKNIVWQVAGIVNLGTTAHAEGIVLSKTAIKLGTGASINGRLLAQTAVDIASSTVTQPAP